MAKFPIQRAPEKLGVVPTTAVRAAIDVRTDEEVTAQAVSGLGIAIAKIGLQRKQDADLIEADTQLSTATREANRIANEANDLVFAAKGTDEETFNKIASGLTQRMEAARPKNEKAARAFDRRMAALIPQLEEDIANGRLSRIETDYLAEEKALWDELYRTGNPEDLLIKLKKGKLLNIAGRRTDAQLKPLQQTAMAIAADTSIKLALAGDNLFEAQNLLIKYTELLTPDQKMRLKNSIKAGLKVIEEKAIDAAKEVLLNKIQGLPAEDAFAVIDADKTIPFDEKKGVRQEWSIRKNAIEIEEKIKQQNVDDEWTSRFTGRLRFFLDPDGGAPPTFAEIEASPMSIPAKARMRTQIMTFDNYSEQELKEAFQDKGEVLADIYNKIDNGTLTDELDAMVGKGLSPITAERIKKEIRVPYEKDTEQMFKRLFGWSPELGFADEMAAFLYEKALREWTAEIKLQDATGEKIIEIGRAIVRPYFIEHVKRTMPIEKDIPRIIELALGESEEIEKIEEEGISPALPETKKTEQYEIGETRLDGKGQMWEYIGNNKWRKR